MTEARPLSASLEDYLEAIFRIASEKGVARAKDIADFLNVKGGSVTGALQALSKDDYINYAPYEVITLTDKGTDEAKKIIRKHEILKDFFTDILGAREDLAEDGACKMEHMIPDELVERLISFTEFIQACPRCGNDWVQHFQQQCKTAIPSNLQECRTCMESCINQMKKENMIKPSQAVPVTLMDIGTGEKCIVQKIKRTASATKRLVEMGISRGSIIEVERVAPLGDPIEIKVKGYHLSIRKEEAENIEVEKQ